MSDYTPATIFWQIMHFLKGVRALGDGFNCEGRWSHMVGWVSNMAVLIVTSNSPFQGSGAMAENDRAHSNFRHSTPPRIASIAP
jgi:hypothetical protein